MIKERLLSLPDEIKELRLSILNKENDLLDSEEEKKTWELMQLDDIASEKDENGKNVYSNDTKRKAELERRKTASEKYMEVEIKIDDLRHEIEIKKIELDKLYSEQKNLRAICRLEGVE